MSDEPDQVASDVTTIASPQTVYNVRQFVDASQLKHDLGYSLNDLSNAMAEQASMFAHYGVEAAKASAQVDTVKLLLENAEAAVYRMERDKAADAGEKVTEALLEKRVIRHPRVISMKKALNEAKQVEAVAKIAVESFRHRKDMLVQHGAQAREELKGELRMGAISAAEQAHQTTREAALARLAASRAQ